MSVRYACNSSLEKLGYTTYRWCVEQPLPFISENNFAMFSLSSNLLFAKEFFSSDVVHTGFLGAINIVYGISGRPSYQM